MRKLSWLLVLAFVLQSPSHLTAHSGRTDSSGGHHDRKNGGYHFHGGGGDAGSSTTSIVQDTRETAEPVYRTSARTKARTTSPTVRVKPASPNTDVAILEPKLRFHLRAGTIRLIASFEDQPDYYHMKLVSGKSAIYPKAQVTRLEPLGDLATMRTWTDNTGEHKVEAKLVEVLHHAIVLQKSSGARSPVPLERLSEADWSFIQTGGTE